MPTKNALFIIGRTVRLLIIIQFIVYHNSLFIIKEHFNVNIVIKYCGVIML